jgi:hypothetical protein
MGVMVVFIVFYIKTRKKIMDEGMGVIIKPRDDNARLNLDNPGQRKAIIHDVVSILGSKVDINETELMPLARKHVDQGYLAFFIVANEPDIEMLIEVIKRAPDDWKKVQRWEEPLKSGWNNISWVFGYRHPAGGLA